MKGMFKKNQTPLLPFLYCGLLILDFILDFPWFTFLANAFFVNYCHLHSFLKKNQELVVSATFALLSNSFHHKYALIILVSLTRNKFPCQTAFPDKPKSLPNLLPCEINFPAKPVSLPNQFLCQTKFSAKLVSLPNQNSCQTSFPDKPVSQPDQFSCQTSFLAKPVSLSNQVSFLTSSSAKPVFLQN